MIRRAGVLAAIAAFVIVAVLSVPQPRPAAAATGFVARCGIHFCLNGNLFYVAGANTYDVFTYGDGSNNATQNDIETRFMDKARIDAHFAQLQADRVTVNRIWMFSHETWHGFETAKGTFNEAEWDEFDYIIQSAKAHNVMLIPTFENYWEAYGGIDTRLSWEGLPTGQSNRWTFFNQSKCAGCFTQYQNYVKFAINRVNHYSGVLYRDDPTIFAWDMMNEPRYQGATPNEDSTGTTLRAWVDTMGQFIKNLDPNHMLYAGIEGHQAKYGFGGDEGNPFVSLQQSPFIDFTSAHPYPNEPWANLTLAQTQALIHSWISDAHNVVGKPFFMGEFNTKGVDRPTWWQGIYSQIEQDNGDGDAFWWYEPQSTIGDPTYGVLAGAPELAVFRQHSANQAAKNGPGGPTPTPTATISPTSSQTPTPTRTPTPTPTMSPSPSPSQGTGNGGVTPTAVVTSSSPWFNEEQVRLANTAGISGLTVTIVVQRTTGVAFSGQYNTIGGQIAQTSSSTATAVTYTFTLAAGQTLGPGSGWTFAAQMSGSGTAHPTAGDTFTVAYTTGGASFTQTGHF